MIISARFLTKIGAIAYGALLVLVASPASAAIPLSNTPLFLTVTVPPNITLTLDDSGSMSRAWVPEICPGTGDIRDCNVLDNRYAKSSAYNLLYYNPNVIYPQPKRANGTDWTTLFTSAYRNGFDTAFTPMQDLRTQYRPTASLFLEPGDTPSEEYMGHYSSDIDCPNSGTKRCRIQDGAGTWHMGATSCNNDNDCRITGNGQIPVRTPAYYYNFDKSLPNCNGTLTDNDCYSLVVVSSTSGPGTIDLDGNKVVGNTADKDERQNFANWYSFARTRNLATVTAATISFSTLDTSSRVAWQALNTCRGGTDTLETSNCQGWKRDTSNVSNAIGTYGSGTQKSDFYSWLAQLPTNGGTPLPDAMDRVGRYYQLTKNGGPYDNNPESSFVNTQLACRRNYHIMMTDGIWNDGISGFGNKDSTNVKLPATVDLNPDVSEYFTRAPYRDDYSNTLADVAFHYWINDLVALDNILAPVFNDRAGKDDVERFWNAKNDPATWQHMVNYTIGLGLSGYLSDPKVKLTWNGSTYGGSYPLLAKSKADGGLSWPNANSDDQNPANVADLWHAAINSRGQFFSADDPASLAASFQAALTAITGSNGSSAALSANSTSAQSGITFVYQAKFNRDWSGTLLALPVSSTGKVGEAVWDAGEVIPSWKARRIFTRGDLNEGVEFASCSGLTSVGATLVGFLNTSSSGTPDGLCQKRLEWIRGNVADEQRFTNGVLRNRPTSEADAERTRVMGDIINSDPAYVEKPSNAYELLPDGTPGVGTYKDFAASIASRPPMVYVGANDGMLHGIDAKTGVEQFAYIPQGVHATLARLADPNYTHRYYVDGGVTAGDAYVRGEWKTVAVGGLNAGGRTIYALDVTNPAAFDQTSYLWEFSEPTNMGLSFSQPQIGVTESGHWVAIFGNGYNSPRGTAHLYVVSLNDGTILRQFPVGPSALADNLNGLSTPLVHDSDNNGRIDTVYAGDLQGNLWKFDLSGKTFLDWKVDFSGAPLFTAEPSAGVRQPITSQPKAAGHPDGGYVIMFGTGRYLALSDVNDKSLQTYYGIRDFNATGSYRRANLQVQTITMQKSEDGEQIRGVSANVPDWSNKRGWYLDLVDPGPTLNGERVVSTSLVKLGRAIFVTVIPSTDPCVPGGKSWLMELDVINGGTFPDTILDVNGDGKIDSKDDGNSDDGNEDNDQVATGMLLDNLGISKTPIWLSGPGEIAYKMGTGTSGAVDGVGNKQPPPPPPPCTVDCEEEPPPPTPVQRRSWIQIR